MSQRPSKIAIAEQLMARPEGASMDEKAKLLHANAERIYKV